MILRTKVPKAKRTSKTEHKVTMSMLYLVFDGGIAAVAAMARPELRDNVRLL